MQAVNAYLMFNGNCEEAFRLYEESLGGKLEGLFRYGDSPMKDNMPAMGDKVMHVTLTVGQTSLMGSDAPPDRFQKPQGTSICFASDSIEEAERAFGKLAEGGQVSMPLQKTFWATRFGMLVDRFGVPWMVNCDAKE